MTGNCHVRFGEQQEGKTHSFGSAPPADSMKRYRTGRDLIPFGFRTHQSIFSIWVVISFLLIHDNRYTSITSLVEMN